MRKATFPSAKRRMLVRYTGSPFPVRAALEGLVKGVKEVLPAVGKGMFRTSVRKLLAALAASRIGRP